MTERFLLEIQLDSEPEAQAVEADYLAETSQPDPRAEDEVFPFTDPILIGGFIVLGSISVAAIVFANHRPRYKK